MTIVLKAIVPSPNRCILCQPQNRLPLSIITHRPPELGILCLFTVETCSSAGQRRKQKPMALAWFGDVAGVTLLGSP